MRINKLPASQFRLDRSGFWAYKSRPFITPEGGRFVVEVVVRDNNVDQALRALKKKMQREGIFREMKMRRHFEKPSEERVRRAAEAVRRTRKLARKNADKND
jgi:small subunit ribosomal protein S21